jgi:H+-transporting ATPase
VRYSDEPEKWNMPIVLGVATLLGVAGVIESCGLFYLGDRIFHLNRDILQTLIYLKVSVAEHLTIFVTRTRGPFWSIRPAPVVLLGAVIGTQVIATLIAVFGLFMDAAWLGLGRAGLGIRFSRFPARRSHQAHSLSHLRGRRASTAQQMPAFTRA